MSVGRLAGRSPPASLATTMPTRTSSKISRTPSAASSTRPIRRLSAVISSAYPASARPATMIVVGTAPFTDAMVLRFVVTGDVPVAAGGRPAGLLVGQLHAVLRDDLPPLEAADPDLQHVEERPVVRVAAERLGVPVDRAAGKQRHVPVTAHGEPVVLDRPAALLDSRDPGGLVLGLAHGVGVEELFGDDRVERRPVFRGDG